MEEAYLDTNIFDYAALRNPTYGEACRDILEGIDKEFSATCSFLVPIEILGSLSRKGIQVAQGTLIGFFSFNLKIVSISQAIITEAAEIPKKTGINGYDAIHAATMKNEGLTTIITENYSDFEKIRGIRVIRPHDYRAWLASK